MERTSLLLIFGLCASVCQAQPAHTPGVPYKYVTADGHVRFTDRPPHDGYVKLVHTWKGWREPQPTANYQENRRKYRQLVIATSRKYQLPPGLAEAVVTAESYFDPRAVSSAGAVGLMQLMPATARRYGVYDRWDPALNVDAGVRYLRDLLVMFDHDIDLALAGYNAGERAVQRHGGQIPPYRETQQYVERVKQFLAQTSASE